jgi:hypothetical protein
MHWIANQEALKPMGGFLTCDNLGTMVDRLGVHAFTCKADKFEVGAVLEDLRPGPQYSCRLQFLTTRALVVMPPVCCPPAMILWKHSDG